jgi:hypothetical protein
VIEQITYLLFLRRLDELQTLEEQKAQTLGIAVERHIFPKGNDAKGRSYADFRWSRFKDFEARDLYDLISDHVFPFLRNLGGDGSTYAQHMRDARFTIQTPALLVKAVDLIAALATQFLTVLGEDCFDSVTNSWIASMWMSAMFHAPKAGSRCTRIWLRALLWLDRFCITNTFFIHRSAKTAKGTRRVGRYSSLLSGASLRSSSRMASLNSSIDFA